MFRILSLLGVLVVLLLVLFLTTGEKQEPQEKTPATESPKTSDEKVRPSPKESRAQASQRTPYTTSKPLPLPPRRQAPKKSGEVPVDVMEEARKRSRDHKDPVYIEKLIEQALKDPDSSRRVRALSELGFIGPRPEIVQGCIDALKDPEESVREEAIQSLETLEDPAALGALREIARSDPSQDLREEAAEALEELESVTRLKHDESQ